MYSFILTSLSYLDRYGERVFMRYERSLVIIKRHENLLKLIGSGSYSSPSLAERLSVSEQTVYRDILFLRRQGHSIESVRLSKGWAYHLPKARQTIRPKGGRH